MDAMQWALSLSWEEFNNLNEATNAEILDLFAEEVHARDRTCPLVVDGGLSYPHLLSKVLPVDNVLCLQREEEMRAATWDSDENKLQMKNMVLALPNGRSLWNTFRCCDTMIARMLDDQCREAGIRLVDNTEKRSIDDVTLSIIRLWDL